MGNQLNLEKQQKTDGNESVSLAPEVKVQPKRSTGRRPTTGEELSASFPPAFGGCGSVSLPSASPRHTSVGPQGETTVGYSSLSPFQKMLLRKTWNNINKVGTGGIGSIVFQRLFSIRPEFKKMFQKTAVVEVFQKDGGANGLQAHIKFLVDWLDLAINSLDDLEPLAQQSVQYGEAHATLHGYGMDSQGWDEFGQILVEAITCLESIRKHKELVRAWRILASFLVDKVRQGYETGIRRQGLMRQKSIALQGTSPKSSAGLILTSEQERDESFEFSNQSPTNGETSAGSNTTGCASATLQAAAAATCYATTGYATSGQTGFCERDGNQTSPVPHQYHQHKS